MQQLQAQVPRVSLQLKISQVMVPESAGPDNSGDGDGFKSAGGDF